MKKTIVILVSLLLFAAMPTLSINRALAMTGAANFLPNNRQPVDTDYELRISLTTAEYITSTLASFNYPYGCMYCYDEDCTRSQYLTDLSTLQNYDQVTVYSKGHRGTPYESYGNHISLLDYSGDNETCIKDSPDIYDRTSTKNVVTFIWHCETAQHYEYEFPYYDDKGYYGMPYCWTHRALMPKYTGTTGTGVFLGWSNDVPDPPYPEQRGGSPQYEYRINDYYNYTYVAARFWNLMCSGYSVWTALNTLSDDIYDQTFQNTDLYGWLIVYGNRNLELP